MKNPINTNNTQLQLTEDTMTLLTVHEVASMLMVGKNRIYELLNQKKLKGMRIGTNSWRIPKLAVYEYIRNESNL